MNHDTPILKLSVLLIEEEDGWWSAQCLEHDIAAQAKKLSELRYEFERTLNAYLTLSEAAGEPPLANIGPAPAVYWDLFEASDFHATKPLVTVPPHFGGQLEPPRYRIADATAA